jgi:hypothetical protein
MNAPCFPTTCVPSAPTWTAPRIVVQVFNGNTMYYPSAGLTYAVVECIGGGGAGGAVQTANAVQQLGGGGGGGGGYSRRTIEAMPLIGGVAVTVGAGGGAGAIAWDGGPGGTTAFGTFCVANGGGGGSGNTGGAGATDQFGQPGAGAPLVGAAGDFASGGNCGGLGYTNLAATDPQMVIWGGNGAAGPWGGAAIGAGLGGNGFAPGNPGNGPGAGGSGAILNMIVGEDGIGPGAAGICVVTEYCLGPVSGGDCGCVGGARVSMPWQGFQYDD